MAHTIDRAPAGDIELYEHLLPSLPPEVRHRAVSVVEHGRAQSARAQGEARELQALQHRRLEAEGHKADTIHRYTLSAQAVPDDELKRLDATIEGIKRTVESATTTAQATSKAAGVARDTASRIIMYIAQVASSGEKLKPKTVSLGRGDPRDLLASTREKKRQKRAEAERIRNAGAPASVLKEQIGRQLDEALAKDPFKVRSINGEGEWTPPVMATDAVHQLPARVVAIPDLLPLMLSLFGDQIRARLFARVDADVRGDTSLRLPKAEKHKRLAELRAELLELDHEECALIVTMAGPNALELAFPHGVDPRAVLGVTGPVPMPR